MMRKIVILTIVSCLLSTVLFCHALDVPYLSGRVVDTAQLLSPETTKSLTEQLQDHETRTGNQIAVLTLPTLAGESIEGFAVKVFETWKLGHKGKDNGVLLIIASKDRKMRIEVGYGLEHVLTDLTAGRIIQQVMTPRFKAGDFNGGITDGAMAIIKVLDGEALPAGGSNLNDPELSLKERIILGVFVFGIIGLFTFIGIVTPGGGWFLYFFLIPFWMIFPILIFGTDGALICLGSYLVLFPVTKLFLRHTDWYKKAAKDMKSKGRASIGGFTLGASSGRFYSGGGGFSGGGFSGGGGSSGGGGASGGW